MSDFLDYAFHHSEANILGGHNYYGQDNTLFGYSQENIFGGHDVHSTEGQLEATTRPNIFGGIDVYNDHQQLMYQTHETGIGTTINDGAFNHLGTVTETSIGGAFNNINGVHTSWQENILGGVSLDPFSSIHSVVFPPFI